MADLAPVSDQELLEQVHRMTWLGTPHHEQLPGSFEYRCLGGQTLGSALFFSRDYEQGLCLYCLAPLYRKAPDPLPPAAPGPVERRSEPGSGRLRDSSGTGTG